MALITKPDLERVIRNTKDPEAVKLLVERANDVGNRLAGEKLSTSQIRALFGEVRHIQSLWSNDAPKARNRLILLKPKMAYRSKKENSKAVGELVDILDPAIDLVVEPADASVQKERFTRFVELFEAILAYHRFHGGK